VTGRYFGSKSSKYPVRSTLSPDNQYLISGSEDGKPYLWDIVTHNYYNLDHLGFSLKGPVTDVAWNPEYHMIACCGFGDSYPILLFVSKNEETNEISRMIEKIKNFETLSSRRNGEEQLNRSMNKSVHYDRDLDDHFNRITKATSNRTLDDDEFRGTQDRFGRFGKLPTIASNSKQETEKENYNPNMQFTTSETKMSRFGKENIINNGNEEPIANPGLRTGIRRILD
jgi:WD40 repeat protein